MLKLFWLALDGRKNIGDALDLVTSVMEGPCGKYIRGVKGNDFLDRFGCDGPRQLAGLYPSLSFFIDRKFNDVVDTVRNIVNVHQVLPLEQMYATVMAASSFKVFRMLATDFPGLSPIIMCVPTDISPEEGQARWGYSPSERMDDMLAELIEPWQTIEGEDSMPARHAIASFDTIDLALGYKLIPITPGIRDAWMLKGGGKGGQERVTGVVEALKAGAEQLVLGNQLFRGNPAEGIDAMESQRRTAELLDAYFAELAAA